MVHFYHHHISWKGAGHNYTDLFEERYCTLLLSSLFPSDYHPAPVVLTKLSSVEPNFHPWTLLFIFQNPTQSSSKLKHDLMKCKFVWEGMDLRLQTSLVLIPWASQPCHTTLNRMSYSCSILLCIQSQGSAHPLFCPFSKQSCLFFEF